MLANYILDYIHIYSKSFKQNRVPLYINKYLNKKF